MFDTFVLVPCCNALDQFAPKGKQRTQSNHGRTDLFCHESIQTGGTCGAHERQEIIRLISDKWRTTHMSHWILRMGCESRAISITKVQRAGSVK